MYSPKTLGDVVFHDAETKELVLKHAKPNNFRNLLLYGPPGTGKTTVANLIATTIYPPQPTQLELLKINGSMNRSIDDVRKNIEPKCRVNVLRPPHLFIVIINEAERMTTEAQDALRGVMDDCNDVKFILTTNYLEKIEKPIQSRCQKVVMYPADEQTWEKPVRNLLKSWGIDWKDELPKCVMQYAGQDNRQLIEELEDWAEDVKEELAQINVIEMPSKSKKKGK
ncbi:AAA family ATPase [Terasakiella sp.]|uniref:AAA family ATPase n=1 Tax=Terasakiella sp. TaxID=2034861 RepID=UPI003AA7E3C9